MQSGSLSRPNRISTRRSSSLRIAWSTCQPVRRWGSTTEPMVYAWKTGLSAVVKIRWSEVLDVVVNVIVRVQERCWRFYRNDVRQRNSRDLELSPHFYHRRSLHRSHNQSC